MERIPRLEKLSYYSENTLEAIERMETETRAYNELIEDIETLDSIDPYEVGADKYIESMDMKKRASLMLELSKVSTINAFIETLSICISDISNGVKEKRNEVIVKSNAKVKEVMALGCNNEGYAKDFVEKCIAIPERREELQLASISDKLRELRTKWKRIIRGEGGLI